MNAPTDWLTALLILAAGLILGGLLLAAGRRRQRSPMASADREQTDLEARRDALIEQLRDPATTGTYRHEVETEAAEVLRKLDSLPRRQADLKSAGQQPLLVPGLKGFLWGAGISAVVWALIFLATGQTTPRAEVVEEAAPVAAPTPQSPSMIPAGAQVADLQKRVQADPSNLDLRIELANAHLQANDLMKVFEETKVVLDQRPDDSRALTLQAVVRSAMGEGDRAVEMLQRATRNDPRNLDAWVALAWVNAQNGKLEEAERAVASASIQVPSEKAMLDQVLQQLRKRAADGQRKPVMGMAAKAE